MAVSYKLYKLLISLLISCIPVALSPRLILARRAGITVYWRPTYVAVTHFYIAHIDFNRMTSTGGARQSFIMTLD
jgi:hypothetical protein